MRAREAIELLAKLIAVPSPSREEAGTADIIYEWLAERGASPRRTANNVWAVAPGFDPRRMTLLLNSHHDTVRPVASWTRDPHTPSIEDGRLYGLGSNDAGASAVSLLAAFMELRDRPLAFNLVVAITAEEEVGGEGGMRRFVPELEALGSAALCAIVGEPTGMQPAVAERGLVVLDAVTLGVSGHAARHEGINAIGRAIRDIEALTSAHFPGVSPTLGPVSINVTGIQAGTVHNVIPDRCTWMVDVRTTDILSNEATVELLRSTLSPDTTITPRSTRIRASVIPPTHPLVKAAVGIGGETFVSPTTSDMSLMPFPSLKIGPGDSARSHRADEYILLSEIEQAIPRYINLITSLNRITNETLEQGL